MVAAGRPDDCLGGDQRSRGGVEPAARRPHQAGAGLLRPQAHCQQGQDAIFFICISVVSDLFLIAGKANAPRRCHLAFKSLRLLIFTNRRQSSSVADTDEDLDKTHGYYLMGHS